jgi:hypothetical protein
MILVEEATILYSLLTADSEQLTPSVVNIQGHKFIQEKLDYMFGDYTYIAVLKKKTKKKRSGISRL